jgi:hypothetical protein
MRAAAPQSGPSSIQGIQPAGVTKRNQACSVAIGAKINALAQSYTSESKSSVSKYLIHARILSETDTRQVE